MTVMWLHVTTAVRRRASSPLAMRTSSSSKLVLEPFTTGSNLDVVVAKREVFVSKPGLLTEHDPGKHKVLRCEVLDLGDALVHAIAGTCRRSLRALSHSCLLPRCVVT
jgi:hypothetical protein